MGIEMQFIGTCPACGGTELVPFIETSDYRVTRERFALVRCSNCGLVVTQPQPVESAIGPYYETDDYISHSAGATTFMDSLYYLVRSWMVRRKLQLIAKYARGKNLIDIGAGAGYFAAFMRQKGWSVEGLEPNPRARKVAHELHGLNLHEINQLFDFPDNQADVVTMWHVLEHVHDPNLYLDEIFRSLTFNGVLFLALPNYRSMDAGYYGQYWAAWDVPRHLWHFSPEAVSRMLERHGFYIVKRVRMPFDPFYVSLLSEKYRKGGMLLRGLIIGKFSYLNSWFRTERASSLIYVLRKK